MLRGGQHVIRRRDPRAEFGVDAVEKVEHVGRLTAASRVAFRGPAAEASSWRGGFKSRSTTSLTTRLTATSSIPWVLLEYIQYSSLLPGVLNSLGFRRSAFPAEILFAGEDAVLGVHVGNATGVQVVVFFGVVAETADFDRDFAVAERVDDDLGLRDGLSLKRMLKRAVPVILFCHCALPKLIIYPI